MSRILVNTTSKEVWVVADTVVKPTGANWFRSAVFTHVAGGDDNGFTTGSVFEQFNGEGLSVIDGEDQATSIEGTHALWHHIRDFLYSIGMEDTSIFVIHGADAPYVALISISATRTPTTIDVSDHTTSQITVTYNPTGTSVKNVTYVSSAPSIATVDATGKISPVAAGSATITITSVADSSKTTTAAITVQA